MAPIIIISYDDLKKDHWSTKDQELVHVAIDFVQHLMNDHDFDYIEKTFGDGAYVQHNRTIEDGIPGLLKTVGTLVKRFPDYTYDVKHIHVDGDEVIFQSHVTLRAKDRGNEKMGLNIIDRWTVKDGKILDHWDAVEAIHWTMRLYALFDGGAFRNKNGIF